MTSLPVFPINRGRKKNCGPTGPDEDAFAGRFSGVAPGDAIRERTRSQKFPSVEPVKSQTPNRLCCKRPLRSSRPRPRTQVVLLRRTRCGPAVPSIPTGSGSPLRCVRFASGQPGLPHRRVGRKGLPLRRISGVSPAFGSTLDQRLGERSSTYFCKALRNGRAP